MTLARRSVWIAPAVCFPGSGRVPRRLTRRIHQAQVLTEASQTAEPEARCRGVEAYRAYSAPCKT